MSTGNGDAAQVTAREGAFHIYLVRKGSVFQVASCEDDSLGFTLVTLHEEGQIDDSVSVGILFRPHDDQTGRWLINPFADHEKADR